MTTRNTTQRLALGFEGAHSCVNRSLGLRRPMTMTVSEQSSRFLFDDEVGSYTAQQSDRGIVTKTPAIECESSSFAGFVGDVATAFQAIYQPIDHFFRGICDGHGERVIKLSRTSVASFGERDATFTVDQSSDVSALSFAKVFKQIGVLRRAVSPSVANYLKLVCLNMNRIPSATRQHFKKFTRRTLRVIRLEQGVFVSGPRIAFGHSITLAWSVR